MIKTLQLIIMGEYYVCMYTYLAMINYDAIKEVLSVINDVLATLVHMMFPPQ